jgi:hypothetical protein
LSNKKIHRNLMPVFAMMANKILRGRQIDNWFFKCYDALIVF